MTLEKGIKTERVADISKIGFEATVRSRYLGSMIPLTVD